MKTLLLVVSLLTPIVSLDETVQHAVQESRRPALDRVMQAASDAGRHANVLGILLAVAIFDPLGPATVRLALMVLVPANLVVEALKRGTDRTRPDGTHKSSNAAFPSSHAANAFALAAVFARRYVRWRHVFWLLAAVIAWSRVYLGRHWLSDTVVGAAIGVLVAWAVMRWHERRSLARAAASSA